MPRKQRLFDLVTILRDGKRHTAEDLARSLDVSVRTIYRDMDTLQSSGIPIRGARGIGYQSTGQIALPPMEMSPEEFEVLNLGIAIVAQAGDPDMARAATRLGDRLEAMMGTHSIADADTWIFQTYPFGNIARAFGHMPTVRSAIKAKQKLRLVYNAPSGRVETYILRPLILEHFGRFWALTGWSETTGDFAVLRMDLVETATALNALFMDEPGKTLKDKRAN
ncbi:MAG: helix-turn-helix transcriptional regulator [Paracoccaceae bacterium]